VFESFNEEIKNGKEQTKSLEEKLSALEKMKEEEI